MSNRHAEIKDIESRIRSSMTYHSWVEQNLGPACLCCDSTDELQVHHIVELYHVLLGLWKLYGDADSVVCHAIAMHASGLCEAVTLCAKCHQKTHPGRRLGDSAKTVRVEDWTTMPRTLPGPFLHHSNSADGHGLTLVSAQLLAGIGWHILAGKLESRMVEFQRSQMARLLGKNPGSSFNRSVELSLRSLQRLGVLVGHHVSGPNVEVHLSADYLQKLYDLPWFMGVGDIQTGKMPVFALRWFLGLQSGRSSYKIGKDKLVRHLGLKTSWPSFVERCVRRACGDIPWASADYDGKHFSFRIQRRGAVPIWTLRSTVRDAIREGS
jgi:hypothetical protein